MCAILENRSTGAFPKFKLGKMFGGPYQMQWYQLGSCFRVICGTASQLSDYLSGPTSKSRTIESGTPTPTSKSRTIESGTPTGGVG